MMVKRSVISYILLSLMFMILFMNFSLAINNVGITSPANLTYNTGVITLNATTQTGTNHAQTITNVTFYYRNSSTDSGWIKIGDVANITGNQSSFIITFDTGNLYDGNTYEFNSSAWNMTQQVITFQNVTNIRINHGSPSATFANDNIGDANNIPSNSLFTFGLATDNTVGIKNCSIVMNSNYLFIKSTNNVSCSTQLEVANFSIVKDGDYTYRVQAHDGNGNLTNSTTRTLTIYFNAGGGGGGGGSPKFGIITPQKEIEKKEITLPEQASDIAKEKSKFGIGVANFARGIGDSVKSFFGGIGNFFKNIFRR